MGAQFFFIGFDLICVCDCEIDNFVSLIFQIYIFFYIYMGIVCMYTRVEFSIFGDPKYLQRFSNYLIYSHHSIRHAQQHQRIKYITKKIWELLSHHCKTNFYIKGVKWGTHADIKLNENEWERERVGECYQQKKNSSI